MDKNKDEGPEAKNSEGLGRVSDSCLVMFGVGAMSCIVISGHIMSYHVMSMFGCLEILIPTEEGL